MAKKKGEKALKAFKPRNPIVLNPILAKGGVHGKSVQTKRKVAKHQLRKQLAELSVFTASSLQHQYSPSDRNLVILLRNHNKKGEYSFY